MGWLRSEKEDEKKKRLKRKKLDARKMFGEEKLPGDVELELDLDSETINEWFEEWLEDKRKVLSKQIEDREKRQALEDKEKDLKKKNKKTNRKEYEPPFHVYKMIRDENKPESRIKSIKATYNHPQFNEEAPNSFYDIEEFARENGNGDYIVEDNNQTYVTTIKVGNIGFKDPMDIKDDEEDDEDHPRNFYRPPWMQQDQGYNPYAQPEDGKKKGKKGKQPQYPQMPYPGYGYGYDPMMSMANPGNIERMVESQEKRKEMLTHIAQRYLDMGMPTHAEAVLKMLDRIEAGADLIYKGKKEDEKPLRQQLMEEMESTEKMAGMMGMSREAPATKMAETAQVIKEVGGVFGEQVVKPLSEAWSKRKDSKDQLTQEITEDMLFEFNQEQQPQQGQTPMLPPAQRQPAQPPGVLGSYQGQPQEQKPAPPAQAPPPQEAGVGITDPNPDKDIDEVLGSFTTISGDEEMRFNLNKKPKELKKLDLSIKPVSIANRKKRRQVNIEHLEPGEEYIINKAIPQWIGAYRKNISPQKMAVVHFNKMTSLVASIFVSPDDLREAYHLAREGYQTYLDMFEPYQASLDPIYNLYKDYGRKGLETGWSPDPSNPDMTVDRMIHVLAIYKKIRPMVIFLQHPKGAEWFSGYLEALVKCFHKKFGDPALLKKKKAQQQRQQQAQLAPPAPALEPEPETPEEEMPGIEEVEEDNELDDDDFETDEDELEEEENGEEEIEEGSEESDEEGTEPDVRGSEESSRDRSGIAEEDGSTEPDEPKPEPESATASDASNTSAPEGATTKPPTASSTSDE